MNIQDAAHMMGHEYPGGAGALADRMGIQRAVFNSKLNPNTTTHHLTLVEALRMQQLSQRFDILFAMAEACGFVCVPSVANDAETIERGIASLCKEFGEFLSGVTTAIQDGTVTGNELKDSERELSELISSAQSVQASLAAMRRKPRA